FEAELKPSFISDQFSEILLRLNGCEVVVRLTDSGSLSYSGDYISCREAVCTCSVRSPGLISSFGIVEKQFGIPDMRIEMLLIGCRIRVDIDIFPKHFFEVIAGASGGRQRVNPVVIGVNSGVDDRTTKRT